MAFQEGFRPRSLQGSNRMAIAADSVLCLFCHHCIVERMVDCASAGICVVGKLEKVERDMKTHIHTHPSKTTKTGRYIHNQMSITVEDSFSFISYSVASWSTTTFTVTTDGNSRFRVRKFGLDWTGLDMIGR